MTASKVGSASAGASDIILNGNRVKLTKMFLRLIKEDRTYCQSNCIHVMGLAFCPADSQFLSNWPHRISSSLSNAAGKEVSHMESFVSKQCNPRRLSVDLEVSTYTCL